MDCAGAQSRWPRVTRLAIVLAALALSLFAASTAEAARSEFFGIAQGRARCPGPPGDGGRPGPDGPLPAPVAGRAAEPGLLSTGATRDLVVGGLASRGIRPVPFVYGSPTWVGNGTSPRPPLDSAADEQAWRDFLKAAVARYGPGGSYWANKYHQQFGASATPLPIQSWQIWNEPNLKRCFAPGSTIQSAAKSTPGCSRSPTTRSRARIRRPRIVLAGMPRRTGT